MGALLYCDITKVNDEERIVEGYASTEAIDVQGEIVKLDAIKDALPDYMKFANIREMHQPSAVGKAVSADIDEKGLYLAVHVVDDSAWEKVKKGVYNGFSIGGKSLSKINGIISKLRLTEISLVDRPANPEAIFNLWKGEGMADEINNNIADEAIDEVVAEKADSALDVLKGYMGEEVWDTATALNALDSIMYLLSKEQSEEEQSTEQIATLTEAVKAIKAFIVSEIQEDNGSGEAMEEAMEYSESNDGLEKSEAETDIEKAGASISGANKAKMKAMHDHADEIMKMCKGMMGDETEKADTEADLEKGEDIAKSFNDLQKAFENQQSEMAKMADRINELEAMPAPSKLEAAIVKKGDETNEIMDLDNLSPAQMIKMVHQGKL